MKTKRNQYFFYKMFLIGGLLVTLSTPVFAANKAESDPDRIQKLFDSPTATSIVRAHNQRIANIEYEMQQVMDLINQYGSFQNRVDREFRQDNQRREMKKVMDSELEKYWEIYEHLKEVRDLLERKPSFRYVK